MGCFCQAEDGIRDGHVTGVQTCALPISAEQDLAAFLAALPDSQPTPGLAVETQRMAKTRQVPFDERIQDTIAAAAADLRSEERRAGQWRPSRRQPVASRRPTHRQPDMQR